MAEAYIVGAVRTPVGKRNGGLSAVHPADMAAHVLTELIARTAADPSAIDDVIMGCVSQIGPQSIDIARTAVRQRVDVGGDEHALLHLRPAL